MNCFSGVAADAALPLTRASCIIGAGVAELLGLDKDGLFIKHRYTPLD